MNFAWNSRMKVERKTNHGACAQISRSPHALLHCEWIIHLNNTKKFINPPNNSIVSPAVVFVFCTGTMLIPHVPSH